MRHAPIPKTYDRTRYRSQMFIDVLGESVHMLASSLKPFHLMEWIDKHTNPSDDKVAKWSSTYRQGIIAAVQRPLNWAVKMGYIQDSPIRYIEKPSVARREAVVTTDAWPKIRDHYKQGDPFRNLQGDPFRNLLDFSWETGCRPEEAKKIETRHVQIEQHRIVFPKEESKGKKKARVIYITPQAEAIIRPLLGTGYVFLNADGKPWTSYAINCRFCRLEKHVGKKFCAYSPARIRHAKAGGGARSPDRCCVDGAFERKHARQVLFAHRRARELLARQPERGER